MNGVWADTTIFDFNDKLDGVSTVKNTSTSVVSAPITLTFTSYNSSRSVQFNQTEKTIKFQGPSGDNAGTSLTVSCPTGGSYAITQIEIFTNNSNINSFSVSTGSYSTAVTTGDDTSISSNIGTWTGSTTEVTFQTTANVDAVKAFKITYTDNRASLSPTFDWSKMEIHNTAGDQHTFVCGTPFVYDSSKNRMKVRLTVTPKYEGIYGTISSSDETVLKTTGYSLTGPTATTVDNNEAWEIYIDNIQVLKTGSATLRFWFNGNASYRPTTLEIPITVIDHSITPFNNSYRYIWDFAGGDWTSTITQLGYGNGDGGYNWTKTVDETHAEARPTTHIWVPTWSGIDMIAGLEFKLKSKDNLCLDWFEGRKAIWLGTANDTIIIPNLVAGQTITIMADNSNYTVVEGTATKSNNVITVTGTGSVALKMGGATRISSIAVSNSQYGWSYTTTTTMLDKERPTSGTFTFTDSGPITGGAVINEVPGITMTVGTSGTNYEVTNHASIGYSSPCLEYLFTPIVNGYLTVNMYSANSHTYIRENDGAFIDIAPSGNIYNGDYTTPNDEPLKAGKTYKLHVKTEYAYNPIYLHSFTFRPAFLNPTSNTDQLTVGDFDANMNTDKSAFPKLINPSSTEQQNKVKFAGDKEKVYLYKNNDVDLLAAGTNILIRGTVLDKNNEDGLVAYYYLNSYVLTVSSYELEDQAYIETSGLTDGNYHIVFSGNVQPADASNIDNGNGTVTVQVQKDADTPWNVTAHTYANQANLFIPINPLEAGATYRITVPANAIALTANADTKNSKIERTFSVNAPGEAQVKMIYPTGLATVGTTIVLETYLNGTASNVNNSHKVKGILSDGTNSMVIDATFGTNQLAFKPTSTLKPNTTYTLTIPNTYDNKDNNIYLSKWYRENEQYYKVTHSKVFTFTTGSSSGTAPYVIANGTAPAEGATIPGTAYSGGTISFTFDQKVELEPYSTVNATPINGREATASGTTRAPGAENSLTVGSDGKTVSFNYETDGLKYDMYYEVVIPANTVVGAGGLPNASPITLHFRMGTNRDATPVNASSFYPHTWDFNKFGDHTASGTTAYNLVNNCGDPKTADKNINSLHQTTDQGYTIYTTKAQAGYGFDQGNDVYFNNKNGEKEVMDEFEGIRISLVSSRSDRFEIRDVTSNGGSTNADGTKKWQFRMNGNTHYMALSNVPAGKLYMVVGSNALIGINSPNAHFVEDDKFLATTHESNTKITNTNGTKKLVLNVTEAGDVTFCLANFTCDKIAVAEDEKTFKSGYAESGKTYATDRLTYDVRYDLLNAFTDHIVKAYYVTGIVDNAEDNTATINAREVTYGVAGADEGVILLYQAGVAADTNVPVFKADVNSAEQSGQTNELKVIESNTTTVPTPADDCYMYVLSNKGSKSDGVAFYRYTGNTFSDRAAYLEVPKYMVNPSISGGSARSFRMVFYNEDGSETTVIRTVEKDGVTEKAEQAGGYYDLRGQRLAKPNKRGLYIKNGKKVYVQ